jgi:hypothetical protein
MEIPAPRALGEPLEATGSVQQSQPAPVGLSPLEARSLVASEPSPAAFDLQVSEPGLTDLIELMEGLDAALATMGNLQPNPGRRYEVEVEDAVRQAKGRGRAVAPERDQRVFELGSVFEDVDGMDLDDYLLVGAMVTPAAVAALVGTLRTELLNGRSPGDLTLLDLLRTLQANPPVRAALIEAGAKRRQNRDAAAYRRRGQQFRADEPSLSPTWRAKAPTVAQGYLICRILEELRATDPTVPDFRPSTRGEASDWIAARGGNPRFAIRGVQPEERDGG